MLVIFQNVIGLHASRGCIISKIFVFEMDLAIRNVKQLNNNRSRRRKRKTNKSMTRLASTVDGLAFLKCAFAAPDFESDSAAGVPDEYSGRTLTKKHRYISTFTGGATDTFFLLLPTPGVAYWTAIAPAGTFPGANILWTPVYYSDTAAMFPAGQETLAVEKFRYISNCFELMCTSNATTWSGSLTTWKFPISIVADQDVGTAPNTTMTYSVKGLHSVGAVGPNNFITPSNMGVYVVACHDQPSWSFAPIISGITAMPAAIGTADYGQLAGRVMGMGDMTGVVVKVSAPNTSFVVKSWACVEYQLNTANNLYDFTRTSPMYDELSLATYRRICLELPIAVNYFNNESFWERILNLIIKGSRIGSVLPGQYGAISSGVNMVAEGVKGLFL